jgi:4-alpha-glucanotransferase
MNLSPEKKIAGVLAPLFALRREDDLGIGDVAALRQFIEWLAESGFKLVQLLPINEIGGDNSPYNAISAMAIEPTTLHLAPGSPEDLTADDFSSALADVDLAELRRGPVKYAEVKKLNRRLLEKAFARFSVAQANEDRQSNFGKFCQEESAWLDGYVFFRALMEENGERENWDAWPYQSPEAARDWFGGLPLDRQSAFAQRQNFFRYVQWIAHKQWRELKAFADERGVALMGDIPFGISYYSVDVFSRRDEFALDWSAGAPPEPFFKEDKFTQKWGQNWGSPLYRWDTMRARNFDWWRQRVRGVKSIFHLFRIDHVLGFYRIYAFPWRPSQNKEFLPLEWNQMLERTGGRAPHFAPRNDATPQDCEANARDGEEYLRAILEDCGDARVVGEDLGIVPNYVRPNLRSLGIAGFKIPQWEGHGDQITPGDEYDRLSVATYATHDHKPLRKLWEEAIEWPTSTSDQARQALNKIAGFAQFQPRTESPKFGKDFYPIIMEALFKSESWIALVMITDLLARKYRFNIPGTATPSNWTRRMQRSVLQLQRSVKDRARMRLIRDLLEKTGRA